MNSSFRFSLPGGPLNKGDIADPAVWVQGKVGLLERVVGVLNWVTRLFTKIRSLARSFENFTYFDFIYLTLSNLWFFMNIVFFNLIYMLFNINNHSIFIFTFKLFLIIFKCLLEHILMMVYKLFYLIFYHSLEALLSLFLFSFNSSIVGRVFSFYFSSIFSLSVTIIDKALSKLFNKFKQLNKMADGLNMFHILKLFQRLLSDIEEHIKKVGDR